MDQTIEAILLADRLGKAKTQLVTIQAFLLEIGSALSRQRYRYAASIRFKAYWTMNENKPVKSQY